jgi:hypothetical protein
VILKHLWVPALPLVKAGARLVKDILVNNAGIDSPMKPITYIPGIKSPGWELTQGNWKKQLELRFSCTFYPPFFILTCQARSP